MKYLLITLSVLALSCHSGSTLRCYDCPGTQPSCDKEKDCPSEMNSCLRVKTSVGYDFRCWKSSQCNTDYISEAFHLDNFKFSCCQTNLCNSSPMVAYSKNIFSITSLLIVIWVLF